MNTERPYSLAFVESEIAKLLARGALEEQCGPDGGPYLPLTFSEQPEVSAGYVRLWRGTEASPLDRMVHMRLIAGPVETQLLFVFGLANSSMPHLHLQVVQFPPDGCVYNVDIMPRVDPVLHPEWYSAVYSNLRRPYRLATADIANTCARAHANPALAVYMSPWGIASARTERAELERLAPELRAYVDHYIELAGKSDWAPPTGEDLAARDASYLNLFFADELDPRAWHGVYKVVGEARGGVIKGLLKTPLRK